MRKVFGGLTLSIDKILNVKYGHYCLEELIDEVYPTLFLQ